MRTRASLHGGSTRGARKSIPSLSLGHGMAAVLFLVVSFYCGMSQADEAAGRSMPLNLRITKVTSDAGDILPCSSETRFGFYLFAVPGSPQLAIQPLGREGMVVLPPHAGVSVFVDLERQSATPGAAIVFCNRGEGELSMEIELTSGRLSQKIPPKEQWEVALPITPDGQVQSVQVRIANPSDSVFGIAAAKVRRPKNSADHTPCDVTFSLQAGDPQQAPPRVLPPLFPALEQALIEWDWRQQDDLAAWNPTREKYLAAIDGVVEKGTPLVQDLRELGAQSDLFQQWEELTRKWQAAREDLSGDELDDFWKSVRGLKRNISLANPLVSGREIVFLKQMPSMFSHELTQYTGNCARPGGGVFLLRHPGQSFAVDDLTPRELPQGNYQFCDVSSDGHRVLFAYCQVPDVPPHREAALDRVFHLYELDLQSKELQQLTDGPHDHFAGKYLPDGRIICVSTRRGGFHRCGRGPCPVHTLTVVTPDRTEATPDRAEPQVISFHETHEWDPVPLWDGRILYTRWDYVDRNAVFYQQLWTVRNDGSFVQAYYGNNTFNPVGIWEARPIPGSSTIMATAAAHHAMTAGSIIRLDVRRGNDGLGPIERLTPDALFPESEVPVINGGGGQWFNPVGITPPTWPEAQRRFPGHCYRTPYPLSEKYFLAAYSYDPLIGEPNANQGNMFGLYLMDVFGNKELIYRDLNISSLWPVPLPPHQPENVAADRGTIRERFVSWTKSPGTDLPVDPEAAPSQTGQDSSQGTFLLLNVYQAWPSLPPAKITKLRIVQVLPKSTWHANDPPLGIPNISPGKQVLGTVPVEADGSAYFQAPTGKALSFQALDELGQAVQIMRSITYVQPGEVTSCVGCHEPRHQAPRSDKMPLAVRRAPSQITPGPAGSKPFSFPLLVQPVLDRQCVQCHQGAQAAGGIKLTGEPQGRYSVAYNALAPKVPYSDWAGKPGDFRVVNCEPTTHPEFFGARGSPLMKLLLNGHEGVVLSPEDLERLATWMDCNALFYGTFNVRDQARQQRGEAITGPDLE